MVFVLSELSVKVLLFPFVGKKNGVDLIECVLLPDIVLWTSSKLPGYQHQRIGDAAYPLQLYQTNRVAVSLQRWHKESIG